MMKKSGIVIAVAILLAGLTAVVALGATYAPINAGVNYGVPEGSTANQPWGWGGMMGRGMGRGMMGYRYSAPINQNATQWWGGMWSRCAGIMNSLWRSPQGPQANTVIVAGYGFAPQVITVKVSTTVTWTNYDTVIHGVDPGTSSAPTSLWNSGELAQGQSFSYTFTTAGVYTYFCDQHVGMTGVVIVEN